MWKVAKFKRSVRSTILRTQFGLIITLQYCKNIKIRTKWIDDEGEKMNVSADSKAQERDKMMKTDVEGDAD